jgi:FtsZ-binding cell division protein ZapB
MVYSLHVLNVVTDNLMKREEIPAVLDSLKPAINAITDPNAKIIINTLLKIITVLQLEIVELKEKLNTNSKNSSKPPSSEPFKKKAQAKKEKQT